ncbi:MAG TPA: hypothetical protein ENL03_05455, partial [Phycisphaerae bacterium]|nr:hypothetical protein [Phycisphaerae bacterium]
EILKRRAGASTTRWSPDVLQYIAEHVHGSVRELEGAITKLTALSALAGQTMDVEFARQALADHFARADSVVTLDGIEAVAAAFFGVTPADIHSTRRTRTICAARAVTMYLARSQTRMSFPEIGRAIGKNHSSVVLGVKRIEKLLAEKGSVTWSTPAGAREMEIETITEKLREQIR